MEKQQNKRIVLRDLIICREALNPLELRLTLKEKRTNEGYKLRGMLSYSFEKY